MDVDKNLRISSLENEVRDLKTQLEESRLARVELDRENMILKATLEELTAERRLSLASYPTPSTPGLGVISVAPRRFAGRSRDSIVNTADVSEAQPASREVMSDRAKTTLMKLRMERNDQIRRQQQDELKRRGLLALVSLSHVRKEAHHLREEFLSQMQRARALIHSFVEEWQSSANGSQTPIVRHAPINSDHPVALQINHLCDALDRVSDVLQDQWYTFDCFTRGPAPTFPPVKRFLDPIVNLSAYTSFSDRLRTYVDFAAAVNLVNSEMRLPNISQASLSLALSAHAAFSQKLEMVYNAMRLIRSPFSTSRRATSLALRTAMTVEISRDAVTQLLKVYDEIATTHTRRCFQYICHTIQLGKRFSKVLAAAQADRMVRLKHDNNVFDAESSQLNSPVFHECQASCDSCGVRLSCSDCSLIESRTGELRQLIEERRALIVAFSQRRVEHFERLGQIADHLLKILYQYRLNAPVVRSASKRQHLYGMTESQHQTAMMVAKGERLIRNAERDTSSYRTSRTTHVQDEQVSWGDSHVAGTASEGGEESLLPPAPPTLPAESPLRSKPVLGPFGETVFPPEFYFRARRAHTAQESQRKLLLLEANLKVIDSTRSMPSISNGALRQVSPVLQRYNHSASAGRPNPSRPGPSPRGKPQ